jgi:hypothetical protein
METITLINVDELSALLKKHHAEIKSDLECSLLSDLVIDGFCNRFQNVFISPDVVAQMYGICTVTVIAYIKDGIIAAEQTKKYGKYHIRLSDALRFDFKEMRRQLRRKQS